MDQYNKTQHDAALKLGVRDNEIPKNALFLNHCGDLLGEVASFWVGENYTGRVDFVSHRPKLRVLSKFSFQHCR